MSTGAVFRQHISVLEKYLKRTDIVEICINKEHEILVEKKTGEWEKITDKKITKESLRQLTEVIASQSGQLFSHTTPIFSGRIPVYNYRVQVCMGAMVESGIAVSIRLGNASTYDLASYMPSDEAKHVEQLVKQGKTIMINAGTGCGKTTFLNSMLVHIPLTERIITLEDTRELIIPHANHVALLKSKTSTDVAQLGYAHFINALMRLRPDRILLGEIDTENTMIYLNLANSGHSGGISTIHAETPEEALNRICLNASVSGSKGSKTDNLEYAKSAIDAFITVSKKIVDGKREFSAKLTMTEDVRL